MRELGLHPVVLVIAAACALAPYLLSAFCARRAAVLFRRLGAARLIAISPVLCVPYLVVAAGFGQFSPAWCLAYLLLPPAVLALLASARSADPEQRGDWRDMVVIVVLGLAVDLRWFEPAWPPHLSVFNKVVLLDVGIVGFLGVRRLDGVGFDLRLRWRDLLTGGCEFLFYAPVAIAIGLWLGFLHTHAGWPHVGVVAEAGFFTFFFIAVPEELFFRGWMQNLLERRIGPRWALAVTAVVFGLAHFNKRAAHFNWRYVLLAALAGVFYGRAWRRDRRVGASAVTHTLVDTVWSIALR